MIKSSASKKSFTLFSPNIYIFNLFLLFNYIDQHFHGFKGSGYGASLSHFLQ